MAICMEFVHTKFKIPVTSIDFSQIAVLFWCYLRNWNLLQFRARPGSLENILEVNFLVVSYRWELYLSAAFGPLEKYCSLPQLTLVKGLRLWVIVLCVLKIESTNLSSPAVFQGCVLGIILKGLIRQNSPLKCQYQSTICHFCEGWLFRANT